METGREIGRDVWKEIIQKDDKMEVRYVHVVHDEVKERDVFQMKILAGDKHSNGMQKINIECYMGGVNTFVCVYKYKYKYK